MIGRAMLAAVAGLMAACSLTGMAQVAPAAAQGDWPITAGFGGSVFNMDWGHDSFGQTRYMEGVTGWVDWNLSDARGPALLRGLGVEIEVRDISFGTPASLTNAAVGDEGTNLRQDTGLGGVLYTFRRWRRVHPYIKALAGLGSIDFPPLPASPPTYRHDDRTITAFGGGGDVRLTRSIWGRADYEYQSWPDLFGSPNALTPNGMTLGVVYNFSGLRRNR